MSAELPHKMPVVFFRTPAGSEVVRNWLRGLDEGDRNAIGQDLMRVQYRWPVGMPLCRAMGDGLFEVRAKWREGIGRAFYCTVVGQRIVIVHAIIKKTEKTPQRELKIAMTRCREIKK